MCPEHGFDAGDCEEETGETDPVADTDTEAWADTDSDGCSAFMMLDCVGNCVSVDWVGDGVCDDGTSTTWVGDLNCAQFGFDGGDCDLDSADTGISAIP